ncbi:sensor histidine kinase [Bacillus sp. YC2]|uniref:sensor histidine kinase n=1 Tax=Bacillus sp. YC2 TaxID=2861287 RepID=UPI001CA5F9CE|nr:sensor histidine kinase [Bacillus sp. YC2]MBY8911375.1 sensor histidine kinase [Bacillus sp. YC2]
MNSTDFWMLMTKLIVIFYTAFLFVSGDRLYTPYAVLFLLLYLCMAIAICLIKPRAWRRGIVLLALVFTAGLSMRAHPAFLFLLPPVIFDVLSEYSFRRYFFCLFVFVPVLFVPFSDLPSYAAITLFCLAIYVLAQQSGTRLKKYEEQSDNMRSSIEKLTKRLNNSTEYIKQSEYTGKLEERNRLSQAIHDQIGHSMTGALIQMEAAKRMLDTHPEKAAELLQNAIHISKEGIEDIRITLKNMKPPAEQMGIHRLRTFIDEFSAKHGMSIPFTHTGDLDRLSQIQWKVIQENVTEALTNTLKYAGASQIFIDIHVLNKAVKAEVKDNGSGAVQFKKGLGMLGMEERAAALNGTVIFNGTNGFSVTTLLPIE